MVAGSCVAASAALGRVKRSSTKKGFCVVARKDTDWKTKLTALKAKWFYTWGAQLPEENPPFVEFVPMKWGKWGCSAEKMAALKQAGHKTLLGFNEPDRESQANMSVEKAIELWPRLMDTGLRLGSPAGVHPDTEWMQSFMSEVDRRGYRVDFVTVHSYGGPSASHFMKEMERYQKLYKRPLWVTEFAVGDWQANAEKKNKHSPDNVMKFMEELFPAMEKCEYIERYAWFSASPKGHALGTSALFNEDGSLTPLGQFYASV
jgi:hypothetical protein